MYQIQELQSPTVTITDGVEAMPVKTRNMSRAITGDIPVEINS